MSETSNYSGGHRHAIDLDEPLGRDEYAPGSQPEDPDTAMERREQEEAGLL